MVTGVKLPQEPSATDVDCAAAAHSQWHDGVYLFSHVVTKQNRRKEYPRMLIDRAVEGVILLNTSAVQALPVPVVAISGASAGQGHDQYWGR